MNCCDAYGQCVQGEGCPVRTTPVQWEHVGWIGHNPRTGVVEICAHTPAPCVIKDFKMRKVYAEKEAK